MRNKILSLLVLLLTAATGAWAAITTEDIGKVICTDGSLYATKILAQNDGKTAAAMIGYVDTENNKALAIALTDGNNNMDWTQASEYCTGLNTSLPVPNGTWVLPTLEQWNSVLTLEEVVPGYEVYKSESLNTKLNAAKGNALDNDGAPYWTCEETTAGGNYVKQISFNYGMASGGSAKKTATDGSMTRAFLEIELSAIEVTTNAASEGATFTEASFAMPAFDATAEYELVRDMGYKVAFSGVPTRARLAKDGDGKFHFADGLTFQLLDNIDAANPKDITSAEGITFMVGEVEAVDFEGNIFYQLNKETLVPLADFLADAHLGNYAICAVASTGEYDGSFTSDRITLFQGYEVEVAAKEFITYYKDEPLYADTETSADAELYTIQSVSADQATLSAAIQTAPSLTPLLIFNNSDEAKTFLLIPANEEPNLQLTVAPEFQGTLEATTIAASTEGTTNYALNGKAFVFVKSDLAIGANKAWLSINTGVPSARITIVFEDATKIANTNLTNITNGNWYDLNGRKLNGMPTKKGIYMNNGRKVVVK